MTQIDYTRHRRGPRELKAVAGRSRPVDEAVSSDARLLSVEEVANYLGVSDRWIYDQVRSGRLPALYIARSWRLRRSAVDKFADSFAWDPTT